MEITPRDSLILNSLYPPFAQQVKRFMQNCWAANLNVHLSYGMRTFAESDSIYSSGKSMVKGGYSFHNYGLAVDIVFDNSDRPGVQDPYREPFDGAWSKCADLGVRCGLFPGYFWKSFQDKPHYQASIKSSIDDLRKTFLKEGINGLFAFLDSQEKDAFKLPPSAGTIES